MEPPENLALAVGEEHHLHLAYSTVWFWKGSAAPVSNAVSGQAVPAGALQYLL